VFGRPSKVLFTCQGQQKFQFLEQYRPDPAVI
jgi:hypothetical protein